jgi:hemolysin activation/secretion protein
LNVYGFRFAFFGFADFSFLSGTNQTLENGNGLSSIGLGVRIRNDNLVFKTFQLRFGYFPAYPDYSKITRLNISGEQLLSPNNFDSGPPLIIPYR